MQRIDVGNHLIIPTDNHVTVAQAGTLSGTVRVDAGDKNAARSGQVVSSNQEPMQRRVLSSYTNVSSLDFSIFDKAAGDEFGCIYRDRKTDSLGRKNDRRVDADDFPSSSNERPSRISGIQSSIGLDNIVDEPARLRSQRTSNGADDS